MSSRLLFDSPALMDPYPEDDDETPGVAGRLVIELLAERLPEHGFATSDVVEEDWGWVVCLGAPDSWLAVGCGFSGETDNGLNCFTLPEEPRPWHLFGRAHKRARIDELKQAVEAVLRDSGKAHDLRWVEGR